MTIVMAPFMSCGARLPVFALFAAAFFPIGGQNVVFLLYLIGIGVAVLTGLIMKNTILQGQTTPFVMELPPYHVPTLKGVLLRTWDRTKSFMFRAGKIIVPMVLVLNVLNAIGTDGSYGNEDSDKSVLSEIGRTIAPAFAPMGMSEENWPAAVGIFTGVLAKEAVVGTLDALYGELAKSDAAAAGVEVEEESFEFWGGINEAFASIPANLADAIGTWTDPLGLSVGDVSSIETAAEEQEVSTGTFGASELRDYLKVNRRAALFDMAHRFDTDPDALRGMLGKWVAKGRVGKLPEGTECVGGCCKCDPATTEIYEWKAQGMINKRMLAQVPPLDHVTIEIDHRTHDV